MSTQIYLKDETKALLKEVCKADKRTQDAELNYLLENRKAELALEKASQ